LESVVKAYPDLDITALLRTVTEEFSSRYPQIHVVQGDFDASEVIEKAASQADIVLRMFHYISQIDARLS